MMKVRIAEPDLNVGCAHSFEFITSAEALDIASDLYKVLGDVAIRGTIVHTGKAYKVEGTIQFEQAFCCDSCLEDYARAQEFSFSEEYQREASETANDSVSCFSGDYIDIADLIRETILLAQPLNHICSSDCRGLCMKCGANLNKAECGCDRHIIDPRLAALQKILNKN